MANFLTELQSRGSEGGFGLRRVAEAESKDRSLPNLSLSQADVLEDEAARWEYFFNSGVNSWHGDIAAHTFSSTFCELQPQEAQAIVDHWDTCRRIRVSNPDSDQTRDQLLAEAEETARAQLSELSARLELSIAAEAAKSPVGKVFVKLSTRSPKDSKKALRRAAHNYRQRVEELQAERNGEEIDENTKWQILSDSVTSATSVRNADEAMELLLDSDRVYEDLEYALRGPAAVAAAAAGSDDRQTYTRQWNTSLVARAWDPRLRPETEFRGICWDGKLTCLCQYFHPLYFPQIVQEKASIEADVLAKFGHPDIQAAVARLGGHCIIDFARVCPGEVIIVELNPFDGVCLGTFPASTGLFIWDDPVDQKIMQGTKSFEFRVREAPLERSKLFNQCNPDWRSIIYPPS